MPKPTITPSARILQDAQATTTVTDSKGRRITIRKLGALDKMKLFKLVGADGATNTAYMMYAFFAYAVVSIDDVPFVTPVNLLQLEAMTERLGDEGVDAITPAFVELMDINTDTVIADAKN